MAPRVAFALSALVLMGSTAGWIWHYHFAVPLTDQWYSFFWFQRIETQGFRWSELWMQHNEHRIVLPRLLYLADRYLCAATSSLTTWVVSLTQLSTVIALALLARREPDLQRGDALFIGAFAAWLLCSGAQLLNFVWAFGAQHIFVYASSLLVAFVYACAVLAQRQGDARATWQMAVAALLLILPVGSSGNGLFIGLVLIALSRWTGASARQLSTLGFAQLSLGVLYLWHYQQPDGHTGVLEAAAHADLSVARWLVLLGNVAWRRDVLVSGPLGPSLFLPACVGAAGLLALAGCAVSFARRRGQQTRMELVCMACACMAALSGLAVATGRVSLPLTQCLERKYLTTSLVFWTHLVALGYLQVRRARPQWIGALQYAALVLIVTLVLPAHVTEFSEFRRFLEPIREGEVALWTGVKDMDRERSLFWAPEQAEALLPWIQARRLSLFAHPPALFVDAPDRRSESAPVCDGAIDVLAGVEGQTGAWTLSGWAFRRDESESPTRLWMVDARGSVQGMGVGGIPRPDVAAFFHDPRMGNGGWWGALRAEPGERVSIYCESVRNPRAGWGLLGTRIVGG